MAIIFCLKDLHEIAVSLQLNSYLIFDMILCGSVRYQHIQAIAALIPFNEIDSYQLFVGGSAIYS